MIKYTECLVEEMDQVSNKLLITPGNNKVMFRVKLIPADQKWVATMSGELNNASIYFSSFANVNKGTKVITYC